MAVAEIHSLPFQNQLLLLLFSSSALCTVKHNGQSAVCYFGVLRYHSISIKIGNVIERVSTFATICIIGDAHVIDTRNEHQRAQHEHRPHAVVVLQSRLQSLQRLSECV